ncbi:hypothetical protein QUA41_30740 [Microcoleus sp. Pol11C1]|uniref:hypothetical protein n=1 Tax=unclassified Microcoleus TaxID=2642155 RepID=UPI002FD5CF5F
MSAWEDKLKQLISPTESKWPYRVVQIKPNRKNDREIYTLSGREEDIAANGSLFLATYDVFERDRINLEEWFEQWRLGFPLSNFNRETSNYPLMGDKQWRKPGALPKFKDLTPPELRYKQGYREIEYWKDSNNEADSVIMGGTDNMIVDQIIRYEYQGSAKAQEQQSITSDVIRYSGIPEITLYFKGIDKNLPGEERIITGEKTFRFMGYTDNPKMAQQRTDLELIRQSDIDRIGAKIKTIFGTTPPYKWSKGKKQVTYHDWLRGYNLNVFASTHTEGERMVQNVLALRDLQIDEAFIKYGEAKNPVKAYPPAENVQVLGKTFKTPERLPVVDVTFEYATIYLCTLKKTQYIA